jgi:hypothetical protein
MTQAFFWLQGHRSPGIEYSEGLRAWYPSAYNDAMTACIMGDIGQERTLAGEKVFFDKPTEWLAWADSLLEPGGFAVDERVRRLLSSREDNTQPAPSSPASCSNAVVVAPGAQARQSDSENEEPRRKKKKRETQAKYQHWYNLAQEIKGEGFIGSAAIASKIEEREKKRLKNEKKSTNVNGLNADNIKRRLNHFYPRWAELGGRKTQAV